MLLILISLGLFREFHYNYGQYFTLWDRIGGTYRDPFVKDTPVTKFINTTDVSNLVEDVCEQSKCGNWLLIFILGTPFSLFFSIRTCTDWDFALYVMFSLYILE